MYFDQILASIADDAIMAETSFYLHIISNPFAIYNLPPSKDKNNSSNQP